MPAFLKNKWLWIGLVLIVVIVLGFTFMQNAGKAKKAEEEKAAATRVESPYAAIANGKVDVEGGIIQIAARRGGVVREVLVQEGDRVVAGQILARQEDDEARLALQSANADVAQAESQLRLIQVEIRTAQREHDRLARLVASNFVAGSRMDQARDAIATAQARLGSQQASVQTARARRDQAAYNVELTVIRAPQSGRIVRRYANPGAGASTLNVSNMFDLEPDAPRIARAEIVESDIPNISPGQAVEIDALLDGHYEVVTAASLNLPEPDETESSFVGNAMLKARHAADRSGEVALAACPCVCRSGGLRRR